MLRQFPFHACGKRVAKAAGMDFGFSCQKASSFRGAPLGASPESITTIGGRDFGFSWKKASAFRGAPLGASPESITTIGSMDSQMRNCASELSLRSPRNDEKSH